MDTYFKFTLEIKERYRQNKLTNLQKRRICIGKRLCYVFVAILILINLNCIEIVTISK